MDKPGGSNLPQAKQWQMAVMGFKYWFAWHQSVSTLWMIKMVKDLGTTSNEEKWKELKELRGLGIITVFNYLRCCDGRRCDLILLWRASTYRLQEDKSDSMKRVKLLFQLPHNSPDCFIKQWIYNWKLSEVESPLVRDILKGISSMEIVLNISKVFSTSNIPWFHESWDQVRKEGVSPGRVAQLARVRPDTPRFWV